MSTGVRWRGGASGNQGMGDELDSFSKEELQRRPEVRFINNYTVVMEYIRIGIQGVGFLAFLWATVVLLGGYVSDLKRVDFWNLTIIAFVQATGLSGFMADVRFDFFRDWLLSLIGNIASWGEKHRHERTHLAMTKWRLERHIRILILKIIDIALIVIFLPVVFFASFAPTLGILLSLGRLSKQDYGIADGDASKANMKRALNLFYYVSVAHGGINMLYTAILGVAEGHLVEIVSRQHGFRPEILDRYLQQTRQMCVTSPASTANWNLITYGAGLLDSQLPEAYLSGGRALTMLIDQGMPLQVTRLLIRSPRNRIQKLISTLAWRSPAEREMRWLAANIVEHLAGDLSLAQFPGALECISSLLDTSCHNNGDKESLCLRFGIGSNKLRKRRNLRKHTLDGFTQEGKDGKLKRYVSHLLGIGGIFLAWICKIGGTIEQDSKQRENGEGTDEDLVLLGLKILENLARDRHNCTLIYDNRYLLSKIVSPVSSNKFLEDVKSNAAWTKVVDGSLKVVSRLMGSPGSTGEEMRSLIADNSNAVNNLEGILDMDMKSNCSLIELKVRAIEVLTQLVLHHPASSAMGRREKLIESVIHIFLSKDWIEDYLKYEKKKIGKPTTSQHNTLSTSSTQARRAWQREQMAQLVKKSHLDKKMRKPMEAASRLKEKAGEALAMLSSDSEAIKRFTGHEDVVCHLTELLDSKIKTIECKLCPAYTVEIEINTGCRISTAVILKNLSNYVKEPTLRKVLEELLPIQAEASSTPRCWEYVTSCIPSIGNDIENPSVGSQVEPSALERRNHIQQCGERRLQVELLSLVAAIRASGNVDFAATLISLPQPVALEDFVVRLEKMVDDNMYATPACLAIQKLICEMVIQFIPHDRNVEVIEKHDIVGTLLEASKRMAGLESSMLFAGVDRDCHGVALRPLSSDLTKQAQDLLIRRKEELDINTVVPARVP